MNANDTKTLYSFYIFEKRKHVMFSALTKNAIVKILDYVDSFPDNPKEYEHRQVNESEKRKFIKEHILNDDWHQTFNSDSVVLPADSATESGKEDKILSKRIRRSSKRATHKLQ